MRRRRTRTHQRGPVPLARQLLLTPPNQPRRVHVGPRKVPPQDLGGRVALAAVAPREPPPREVLDLRRRVGREEREGEGEADAEREPEEEEVAQLPGGGGGRGGRGGGGRVGGGREERDEQRQVRHLVWEEADCCGAGQGRAGSGIRRERERGAASAERTNRLCAADLCDKVDEAGEPGDAGRGEVGALCADLCAEGGEEGGHEGVERGVEEVRLFLVLVELRGGGR